MLRMVKLGIGACSGSRTSSTLAMEASSPLYLSPDHQPPSGTPESTLAYSQFGGAAFPPASVRHGTPERKYFAPFLVGDASKAEPEVRLLWSSRKRRELAAPTAGNAHTPAALAATRILMGMLIHTQCRI